MLRYFAFAIIFFFVETALAAKPVARVIILRGKATKQLGETGNPVPVRLNERIEEGYIIKTKAKSFVKLLFVDKSQVNIAPKSRLKIETFKKNQAGLLKVISGKVRAKVEKDLLAKEEEKKHKLYLKTKTAAMGVRGTDFQVIYNEVNNITSLVTFEGEVAMVQIDETQAPDSSPQNTSNNQSNTTEPSANTANLENLLTGDNVALVQEGQFSSANPKQEEVSPPTKISPAQLETLRNNDTFREAAVRPQAAGQTEEKKFISIVPPGMDTKAFVSTNEGLEKELAAAHGLDKQILDTAVTLPGGPATGPEGPRENPEALGGPRPGGYIDIDTGIYIAPSKGATFDANTGTYINPASTGTFNQATGEFEPPKGFDIDPTRGVISEKQLEFENNLVNEMLRQGDAQQANQFKEMIVSNDFKGLKDFMQENAGKYIGNLAEGTGPEGRFRPSDNPQDPRGGPGSPGGALPTGPVPDNVNSLPGGFVRQADGTFLAPDGTVANPAAGTYTTPDGQVFNAGEGPAFAGGPGGPGPDGNFDPRFAGGPAGPDGAFPGGPGGPGPDGNFDPAFAGPTVANEAFDFYANAEKAAEFGYDPTVAFTGGPDGAAPPDAYYADAGGNFFGGTAESTFIEHGPAAGYDPGFDPATDPYYNPAYDPINDPYYNPANDPFYDPALDPYAEHYLDEFYEDEFNDNNTDFDPNLEASNLPPVTSGNTNVNISVTIN